MSEGKRDIQSGKRSYKWEARGVSTQVSEDILGCTSVPRTLLRKYQGLVQRPEYISQAANKSEVSISKSAIYLLCRFRMNF